MSTRSPPQSSEELLAQLVSFDTVNPHFGGPVGGEAALAAHLETLARSWGLATRRCPVDEHRFNLLITCEAAPGSEWLIFESHLDTVSTVGMTIAPYALRADGDRLYARGACDTKGSGAAMLWALRTLAREPVRPRHLAVLFAVDEEAHMTGARAFAAAELAGLAPLRGLIVGEPTQLRPVVAHHGVVRWRTTTRGIAAHSADPTKGRSAISAMTRVIDALESHYVPLANRTDLLTGRAAASINLIRGGSAVNIIPDSCEIECDRRLVPGETAEAALAARDATLAGFAVEHDRVYHVPPLPAASGRPLLAWAQPAFEQCGLDATATGAAYVTDASHYAAAGAPSLVLGPGDLAQAHTCDEWLSRQQLEAATKLYSALMRLA
ncbi:MAG: M20 family peptidase [Opitutus sp.]|nr:M20 family peptidase [Opitutus sp.]